MDADLLITSLNNTVNFFPCRLSQPYSLNGKFSNVDIGIKECEHNGQLVSISLENIFELDKKSIENFISNVLPKIVNDEDDHTRERTMFYSHVKNIFRFLGKNVHLHSDYKELIKDDPIENITCSALGMGAATTWHGCPDGRIRGHSSSTNLIYGEDEEDEDPDTCLTGILNESLGDTACVEAKLHCSPRYFPQLVATNIVSSFIEHSLHKELNSAVPTLLINNRYFYVSIYDSQTDLLLISNKVGFKDEGKLIPEGILMLYLTINHRDTLCILKPKDDTCGFRDYARQYKFLNLYESLKEKSIIWKWRPTRKVEVPLLVKTISTEPLPKKRKVKSDL